MLAKARRALIRRLPESLLYGLVRARYGQLRWQIRLMAAVRSPVSRVGGRPVPGYLSLASRPRGLRARIVEEFDAHAVGRENVRAVAAVLDARAVAYLLVPEITGRASRIAVAAEDAPAAVRALADGLTGAEWAVAGRGRPRPVARMAAPGADRAGAVRVFRLLAAPSGQLLAGLDRAAVVEFWPVVANADVPRPDGGTFVPGTRLAPEPGRVAVSYLTPTRWQNAAAAPEHWAGPARRPLLQVREPVDLVYTWVDGDDPSWRERRAACDADVPVLDVNDSAAHDSRYVSRDELRYSMRSVAMYAGWVRKIFIVTDRQVPPWLNTDHPMIEVIDHARIFTDRTALPVFNSHAIESQLHHAPGLSERYLYLNDDVFFGRPVEPELFFHGNGVAKFFLSPLTLDIDPPSSRDVPVMSAAKRNRELIEDRFDATVTNKFQHTPHPQLRSVLEEMERAHPEVFAKVSHSRFRHPDDVSITSALVHYYAYGLGRAVPGDLQYAYYDIARADTHRRLVNLIRTRHVDAFCLNDHASDPSRVQQQRAMLVDFFEQYFPVPSPFERPGG